jgi:hypothetical protein
MHDVIGACRTDHALHQRCFLIEDLPPPRLKRAAFGDRWPGGSEADFFYREVAKARDRSVWCGDDDVCPRLACLDESPQVQQMMSAMHPIKESDSHLR